MTLLSPRIYTYKITFEEVPYYYYGVKKEKYYNQEYWGSPKTNKWCWELYTPKKQILEIFDYSDEGYDKALQVETRLIKPVFNTDKWCLNENCNGKISLESKRKSGIYCVQNKLGVHSLTREQKSENGKKGGEMGGKIGGKISAKILLERKLGIHSLTMEQRIENGKKGGKIGGRRGGIKGGKVVGTRNRENKTGICSLTKEQRIELGKKYGSLGGKAVSRQKWICLETGYISNAGGLAKYQRARGIDTSKRKRIE